MGMLRTQRLLAFVGRVQNYCILLLCFFLLAYLVCGYFAVPETLTGLLVICLDVVCWTLYLLSVWITSLVFIQWYATKVFPASFFFSMLARTAVAFVISLLKELIEHVVEKGITVTL